MLKLHFPVKKLSLQGCWLLLGPLEDDMRNKIFSQTVCFVISWNELERKFSETKSFSTKSKCFEFKYYSGVIKQLFETNLVN